MTDLELSRIRALLDEVERLVPSDGAGGTADDQLGDELIRLGVRCTEVSRSMAEGVGSGAQLTRSACSGAHGVRGEAWNSRKIRGERTGMPLADG